MAFNVYFLSTLYLFIYLYLCLLVTQKPLKQDFLV
uniref:Uncharacterized protein n=1 Tax=Myoviridae sp. ctQYc56 TaxID=2825100 RepID=A0A8S5Q0H9_9CAUD|nr:MAG TPA: hypothetical protein [Myoviridae sp. ctQYc56]